MEETSRAPSSKAAAEIDEDTTCGIGTFKYGWLQKFATPKAYLINYCILGILQGAYFTYTVGVISTIEKRFSFESKISGIILIADNITPIVMGLVIGYYGSKMNRPRLIFMGMLVVVLSCFLSALPYFLYGPGRHLLTRSLESLQKPKSEICDLLEKDGDCDDDSSSTTMSAVALLFFGNFLNGFGYTAFYTIGTPYLDDNVEKKNSPMFFGIMFALRMFGPSLGYLISSLSLSYYEDPFYDPGFSMEDPRWIGAWWMGFILIGVLLFIFNLPILLFPRYLPGSPKDIEAKIEKEKHGNKNRQLPKFKDFPRALMKLLKNPIFVCHTMSFTLQINGYAGYYVFMPKYLESQYRKSASSASLFSGSTSLVTIIIGILLGGFILQKFKPRVKFVTGYMVIVEFFTCFGFLLYMFLGCSSVQMGGVNNESSLYNDCNMDCKCTHRVFEPICAPDNTTVFFSPCFAGCDMIIDYNNSKAFSGCSCASGGGAEGDFTSGYCPDTCEMFLPYIIVMSMIKMVSSTARVGSTLVTLRSVDPAEKDLAVGVIGAALDLFAFIPYPLIFGAMTDSTCLIWEEKCGKTGNCWFYDSDKFRYSLHGLAFAFILAGTFLEIPVFLMSDRMKNFYTDPIKTEEGRTSSFQMHDKYNLKRNSLEEIGL